MFKIFTVLVFLLLNTLGSFAQLKDANLIQYNSFKKTNHFVFKKKILKDKFEYSNYKNILSNEEFKIYKILDILLRANNLQNKNYRLKFNFEDENINATSTNNNLITINTTLYDCLHQNEDALAFAIAHELAHLVLNHQKISSENTYKIKKIEQEILNIKKNQEQQYQLENLSKIINQNYSSRTSVNPKITTNLKNLQNNIYQNQKQLELLADSQALEFIIKAGYNLDLAMEIFDYIDEDLFFYENNKFYPLIYERKNNLLEEYEILNIKNLIIQGQNNIINSKVLSIQKSMNKKSLIINKPKNYKDYSFIPQNKYQKILERGYEFYLKNDINNAIIYFLKAYNYNPKNYIAPLYLSYCYEENYKQNNSKNDLKLAKKYIKIAKSNKIRDKIILEQYKSLYQK